MKFESLLSNQEVSGRCGDLVAINDKNYLIIGYTDRGRSYLLKDQGSLIVYKLIVKAKSA